MRNGKLLAVNLLPIWLGPRDSFHFRQGKVVKIAP